MKKKASSKKARPSKRRASSKPRELTPKQRKARAAKGWETRRAKTANAATLTLRLEKAIKSSLPTSGQAEPQAIQSNAVNVDRFRSVDFSFHRSAIKKAINDGGDIEQTMRLIASDGAMVGQNEASKLMRERHDMTIVFGLCSEVRADGGSNANGVWTLADYVVQAVARVLRRDVLHERGGASQAA